MTALQAAPVISPATLRHVFSAFPTGVTALAGLDDGAPIGLTVGSFTSVSLEPALVSVCISRTSGTWVRLRALPSIGVSVLAAHQADVSVRLSSRVADRFAGLAWRQTDAGAVLLDGASAWLWCSIDRVIEVGDHDLVVLQVHDLRRTADVAPLVFHDSRYRRLETGRDRSHRSD